MLFNSLEFFIFLPLVLLLYWFVFKRNVGHQNLLILCCSYLFYGWWDWRFLFLMAASTLVDYYTAQRIAKTEEQKKRKIFLWISLAFNLGMLGIFKYYNFFIDSWVDAWDFFGVHFQSRTLQIILPVGISFYTFQTLSYTIDVYRRNLEPTKDLVTFASFVSFFPQLVAGPIERASHLLPQFTKTRSIKAKDLSIGLKLILWGLFKKVVVADNLAEFVNPVYDHPESFTGITTLAATFFFAFQIYCDFSGYSDIAIGTARLLGFSLTKNFNTPYFSKSIQEFWSRWHISLSSWFRDYVYIPLGGNRVKLTLWQRNLAITFLISGLWHGANWTFVIWGGIHAVLNSFEALSKYFGWYKIKSPIISISITFILVCFSWVFFRAETMHDALVILKNSLVLNLKLYPVVRPYQLAIIVISLAVLLIFELSSNVSLTVDLFKTHRWVRWSTYYTLIFMIILFGKTSNSEFIYFQF